MDTTWIIVIVVAAVIVLLALAFAVFGRNRRTQKRREQAAGLREEAQTRSRNAKQAELAAQEHAERAKNERKAADAAGARAHVVDPDVDDREKEDIAAG